MTDTIRVRDRRNPHQYTVHNRLIDEWYPIISSHGLALYSLYSRMASKGQEHCYPGLRMIASHMGMGVSTVSDYNSLLVWCELLYIVPGSLADNRASDYYLLEVPAVTPARLHDIESTIRAEIERLAAEREQEAQRLVAAGMATAAAKLRQANGSAFPRTVLRRLEKWQPIQNYWQQQSAKPTIVTGQPSLPLEDYPQPVDNSGGGVRHQDQGDPPVGRGVRHQDHNNPNQQSKSTIQQQQGLQAPKMTQIMLLLLIYSETLALRETISNAYPAQSLLQRWHGSGGSATWLAYPIRLDTWWCAWTTSSSRRQNIWTWHTPGSRWMTMNNRIFWRP